tara:strand:+ start:306 stop:869 length:564 start_codon:yes stop_codon:yes gene_type:complete
MPAIIGTIAQEGQSGGGGGGGASAPTGVSIATSSSGNYDNAVIVHDSTGLGALFDDDGSGFTNDAMAILVPTNQMAAAYNSNAVQEIFIFKGYCRATGATSFAWDVTINAETDCNGSLSIIGTASTSQDATGSDGAGEKVQWNFAGGKSGVQYPAGGTRLVINVNCTATNANGSTDADELVIDYTFE